MRHALGRTASLHNSGSTFSCRAWDWHPLQLCQIFFWWFSPGSKYFLAWLLCMSQPQMLQLWLYIIRASLGQDRSWRCKILNVHFWKNREAQAAVDFSSKIDLLVLVHYGSLHQKINGSDTPEKKELYRRFPECSLPRASVCPLWALLSQFLIQVELYHCSLPHSFLWG